MASSGDDWAPALRLARTRHERINSSRARNSLRCLWIPGLRNVVTEHR